MLGRCWPHDAMRHSYASYHFAMYRDAGLTAKNLGHPSPTLLRKDYNNAVTRAEAERFWSIAPGGVGGERALRRVMIIGASSQLSRSS